MEARSFKPDLNEELTKLRGITADYRVPEDVCESYEVVYSMLAELDKALNWIGYTKLDSYFI